MQSSEVTRACLLEVARAAAMDARIAGILERRAAAHVGRADGAHRPVEERQAAACRSGSELASAGWA